MGLPTQVAFGTSRSKILAPPRSFQEDRADPLSLTFSYDASAAQTLDGVTSPVPAGQLPAGVLQLSATSLPNDSSGQPGSGETLLCSIDVGGAVSGGTCGPIKFPAVGSYEITTTYIVSATNSTTSTETITINPYATTTTLTTATVQGPTGKLTQYIPSVVDQMGNTVRFDQSAMSYLIVDTTTRQTLGTLSVPDGFFFYYRGMVCNSAGGNQDGQCVGTVGQVGQSDSLTGQAVYAPPSGNGWSGSTSQPVPLVFSP